jgi:hypothetical protein
MKLIFSEGILVLMLATLLLAACGGGNAEPASDDVAESAVMNDENMAGMENMDSESMEKMDHEHDEMDHEHMEMDDVNMSTSRASENGLFKVNYTSDTGTIPLNDLHTWTLHVETADGQPVDDATITVDGGMPDHDHGLPTKPAVTENLGNGDYRVEGMKFQMAGTWNVSFAIDAGDHMDEVVFHFQLAE